MNGSANDSVARAVLIVASCFFLFVAFRIGIIKGIHDVVGLQSWGRVLFGVGAAITEMAHGGYGYTIARAVESILQSNGLTSDPSTLAGLGTRFPDNLRNTYLLDLALGKAVQFQWPFDPNQGVRGSGGDDLGFVDFAKISFHLFGYRIVSLYLTFFVIQGLSALAFIYTFRHRLGILAVLLVLTCAQSAVFVSILLDFDPDAAFGIGTLADPRVLSLLGLIPAFHIGCLLLEDVRPMAVVLLLAVFQCSVLVLTVGIRTSAAWTVLALFMLAAGLALVELRRSRSIFSLWRAWSFAVLFLLLAAHQVYVSMTVHPVYGGNNEIRHHVLWQSMFYALGAVHPEWPKKYAAEFDNAESDELPLVAAKKYLLRNPVADPDSVYLTPDRRYLRVGAAEIYTRRAFFEFLIKDPVFVIETFAVYNSRLLYCVLARTTSSISRITGPLKAMMIAALVGLAGILAFRRSDLVAFARAAVLATAAFAISLLPIVLTAPSYFVIADQFFVLLLAGGLWTVTCLAVVIRTFATGGALDRYRKFWHYRHSMPSAGHSSGHGKNHEAANT